MNRLVCKDYIKPPNLQTNQFIGNYRSLLGYEGRTQDTFPFQV